MVLLSDREHRDAGSVRNRRQTCKEARKCSSQSYLSSSTPVYSASVILLQNFNQTQSRQRSVAFPLSAQQTSYKKPTEVHPKHFQSPGSITSCRAGELHSSHPSSSIPWYLPTALAQAAAPPQAPSTAPTPMGGLRPQACTAHMGARLGPSPQPKQSRARIPAALQTKTVLLSSSSCTNPCHCVSLEAIIRFVKEPCCRSTPRGHSSFG